MREEWKEFKLGDHIHIKHGYAFKGEYFKDQENTSILLTPGNFKIGGGFKDDKLKYYDGPIPKDYILKAGDIIVTMTDLSKMADTLGYSAKIPNNKEKIYLHNQRIGLVEQLNNDLDLEYLYWLMRFEPYQKFVAGSATGATVKHTSPSKIYAFKFYAPVKIDTQKKIAQILSAYDDLIENNLKRIKLLEEMAQMTYEEWFVRLKFPGHEHVAVDEETGLPLGWRKVKCFDIMEVLSGGTPKTINEKYWNGKIKFFTPKDATGGSYTNHTEKTITIEGLNNCNSKLYPKNTVFITARGTVGKLNLAAESMAMNQSCYALVGKDYVQQFFLFNSLKNIVGSFKSAANGGVFDTIVVDTFKYLPFVLPTKSLIEKFEDRVKPFYLNALNIQTQNQHLKEARDILLPRLMTGRIDVDKIKLPSAEEITNA